MGMTLAEKIIARAARRDSVQPDEVLWVDVDMAMTHDSSGPRRFWPALKELGVGVWDPDRLVIVADHYVPAADVGSARILQTTREFVAEYGIERFHEAEGISHTLMVEKAYVRPGMLYVGGDSHSLTAGVLGCLAVGVGSTDMLGIVATGRMWLRVPKTIRVVIEGDLAAGVTAKDMILTIIGDQGMDGGLYRVLEFGGEAVAAMGVLERSVLTNMCAEIGAKSGIVPADATTVAYLADLGVEVPEGPFSDVDATFEATWSYDASHMEPVVARPHKHDDVIRAADAGQPGLNRAYIGACTGAKYSDLAMAADILEGRKVAKGVLLQVAPASRAALQQAMDTGVAQILMEAGAHILSTGCGACPGIGSGVLGPGEVCISTTSRNARGRMGSPDSEVWLGSPYTVAAAAVAGKVIDPRELLKVPA